MTYHGYIYITFNQQTKLDYVGQKFGLPEKTPYYLGSGTKFKQIIKQYGKKFFKKRVLGCLSANTKKELKALLDEAETECIYFFRTYGSDGIHWDEIYGYNKLPCPGKGTLGCTWTLTKENRQNQSMARKIIWSDPEFRKQACIIQQQAQNKPSTIKKRQIAAKIAQNQPETKIKRSISTKIAQNRPEVKIKHSGKNNYHYRHDVDQQISEIRLLHNCGMSFRKIAKIFNCSSGVIQDRLNRQK